MKHWNMILDNIGDGNKRLGRPYLEAWIKSVIQRPFEGTDYLRFICKGQACGASSFHEALGLFLPVVYLKTYLSGGTWNGHLVNALIGVIEEINVNTRSAAGRVQSLQRSRMLTIDRKAEIPVLAKNSLHLIEITNNPKPPTCLDLGEMATFELVPLTHPLDKHEMMGHLKTEAPEFFGQLLTSP